MATPPEQPWSNHEKNYLLAEIVKSANPPPEVLLNVIRSLQIQPQWEDIPLPPGRSLRSCHITYEQLASLRPLSLQSIAPLLSQHPSTPISTGSAPGTLKRPFPFEGQGQYAAGPTGREIRPKPPPHSGPSSYNQPSPTTQTTFKKKRGRPTKAEAAARAEAAQAAAAASGVEPGAVAPVAIPRLTSQSYTPGPSKPPPAAAPPEETKPAIAPSSSSTRMGIAAMLTPTARDPQSGSQHSSSSSGRKRRARSAKFDTQGTPTAHGSTTGYESPYASRALAGPEDSPARTAVLRHRDDPANIPRPPSQQQQPGNSQRPGSEPRPS